MLQLDFDCIHSKVRVADLIAPMRRAFAAPAVSPQRHHYDLGAGSRTLLIMPAWRPGASIGVKIATVFAENRDKGLHLVNGSYLLLSAITGQPHALIDGRALTLLRTAAVSALAAELQAPRSPNNLLIVGTGALAKYLLEGHRAVRRYESVSIWGRDPLKAAGVVKQCLPLECDIQVESDLERAVRKADVISCATSSKVPLIKGSWLKEHCHLDLVGSFKPDMREIDRDCLRRAFIAVDSLDALSESGDLIGPQRESLVQRARVKTLTELIQNADECERSPHTIFKSVGVAIADLAAAEHLVAMGAA